MKSYKNILLHLFWLFLLFHPFEVLADWSGREEVVSRGWGNGTDQFGLKFGDTITYDVYPEIIAIIVDEKIFINDNANKRGLVYTTSGQFIEIIPIQKTIEGEFTVYKWTKYFSAGQFSGFDTKTTFWTEDDGKFRKYDSLFNLIQTVSARPLELGKVTKTSSGSQWHYEVEYPNGIFIFDGPKDMLKEDGLRWINPTLIMQNFGKKVYAFTVMEEIPVPEGEKKKYKIDKIAEWIKPKDNLIFHKDPDDKTIGGEYEIIAQYGDAVIGPDGSTYTWMRSETHYKILRWKWIDKK